MNTLAAIMIALYLDIQTINIIRKNCNNDFPVHDCTQGQNDSSSFSFNVRQCKWPSLSRKIVEIQKFGHHGKVTSHVSSLLM